MKRWFDDDNFVVFVLSGDFCYGGELVLWFASCM